MRRRSLRLRLLLAALASVGVALLVAGIGLVALFSRSIDKRIDAELDTYIRQLTAAVAVDADGTLRLARPLADPRFEQPYGGLYWQIQDDAHGIALRSRSLWDTRLDLPADPLRPGVVHVHTLPGPRGAPLLVRERPVILPVAGGERTLRIAVGLDMEDILRARGELVGQVALALGVLGAVLLAAAWVQVGVGLSPLEAVRRGLNAVNAGQRRRLEGAFPDELQPLVGEVNQLLAAQERAMEAARARAAELAHGLKTPLSVIAGDAARLRAKGETAIADELEELAGAMRRHVEHELTRARLQFAGAGRPATKLADAVEPIVRTLRRTPAGAALDWRVAVPSGIAVALEPPDLAEVLGNLLENAARWARGGVEIEAAPGTPVRVTVADDGPGVPPAMIDRIAQRGVRLDERPGGAGIGLAIVRDILEAYGGALRLENRPEGGLRATIDLPAAG
jgi:signal transduction histidine kinase